jgi:hypothetical protein
MAVMISVTKNHTSGRRPAMKTISLTGALALAVAGPLALAISPAPGSMTVQAVEEMPMLFYWKGPIGEGPDGSNVPNLLMRTTDYAKAHYPEMPVRILMGLTEGSTVYWFEEHESFAAQVQLGRKMQRDDDWRAINAEWDATFDQDRAETAFLFPLGGAGPDEGAKPLRWLRITHSPPALVLRAQRLAGRVAEYLEANYPGVDARAYSSDIKDASAIFWMIDYENTSSWESIRRRLLKDEEYARLFDGSESLFLEEAGTEFLKNW